MRATGSALLTLIIFDECDVFNKYTKILIYVNVHCNIHSVDSFANIEIVI